MSGSGRLNVPEVVLGVFDEALGLWRGLPYAEFADEEFASCRGCPTGRAACPCDRGTGGHLLELGHPEDVIGELETAIAVQPFRERLRAL